MSKSNAVALNANIDKLLKELSVARKDSNPLVSSKVSIVADLIMKAHKKECK